ncbi:hypothetical protein [Muriicola sp.]|uniref:hypothetical protein n=1 Tax=Muriicola sp. TaxID=2020856 RepID=UPI003C74D8D2
MAGPFHNFEQGQTRVSLAGRRPDIRTSIVFCSAMPLQQGGGVLFYVERAGDMGRIPEADFLETAPGRYLNNERDGANAFKALKDVAVK